MALYFGSDGLKANGRLRLFNSGTVVGTPFLSAISADGQFGTASAPGALPAYSTSDSELAPNTSPITVGRTRTGYDSSAALLTNISEPVIVTRRVRQPYTGGPNTHLLGSTATCSLSDSVWSTDVMVSGCTNNSADLSPKPIAQWARRNRRVCGNTLRVELVAFHISARAGKPIAAATVTVTDGTITTSPLLMTGPAVLTSLTDRFPVIGYYADLDTSGFADGTTITVNGAVYPRIGGAASVLDSSAGTADARGFTPQVFYKHAAKDTSPPFVYCDKSTGVDAVVLASGATSGAVQKVSTNAATAKANPFLTMTSAINALKAATSVTGGFTDGCRVRLGAGSWGDATTGVGTYQQGGELIVESDPAIFPSTVIINPSANFRQSWLTYSNLAIMRTTATQLATLSPGRLSLEAITSIDFGVQTSTLFSVSTTVTINGIGATSNQAASSLVSGTIPVTLMRGVKCGVALATSYANVDGYNVLGCEFYGVGFAFGARPMDGGINAYFVNLGLNSGTTGDFDFAASTVGFARVQYVEEFCSSTSNPVNTLSADNGTVSVSHFLDWYGTQAGASIYGRRNEGYDERIGTYRVNKHWQRRGGIPVASFTKHDWFIGTAGGATAAEAQLHVGSWGVMYGVNDMGNVHQYPTDSGSGPGNGPNGDRNPAFFGLGSTWSTATYTRLDPLYVNGSATLAKATRFNGTTATAGTGGVPTDYTLASGSPAKAIVAYSALPFDLAGSARAATNDTAGAYTV